MPSKFKRLQKLRAHISPATVFLAIPSFERFSKNIYDDQKNCRWTETQAVVYKKCCQQVWCPNGRVSQRNLVFESWRSMRMVEEQKGCTQWSHRLVKQ